MKIENLTTIQVSPYMTLSKEVAACLLAGTTYKGERYYVREDKLTDNINRTYDITEHILDKLYNPQILEQKLFNIDENLSIVKCSAPFTYQLLLNGEELICGDMLAIYTAIATIESLKEKGRL